MKAQEAAQKLRYYSRFEIPKVRRDDETEKAFATAISALEAAAWHDLREDPEDMPPEHESIFNRFYGTDRWSKHMFRTCSDKVDVTLELADGSRCVETFKTWDGKWHFDALIFRDAEVIAWRPRSQPYDG